MNNQAFRLAQTGDVLYPMRVILFIALICMSYQLSRPNPSGGDKKDEGLLLRYTALGQPNLPSWQRRASENAVVKYAESQDKKWRRWNEAMFERSS